MARILGDPARKAPRSPRAQNAVTVQRDELTDAIQSEIGRGRVVDYQALAKMLVRSWQATDKDSFDAEPKKAVKEKEKDKSDKTKADKEAAKSSDVTKAPVDDKAVAKKRLAVEARERRAKEGASDLEKESEDLDVRQARLDLGDIGRKKTPHELELEKLEGLKKERTEEESLRKEEEELRRPRTAREKANLAKRAELDKAKKRMAASDERAKKREELDELKRKLSGRLTLSERADRKLDDELAYLKKEQEEAEERRKFELERERNPLNPQGKKLSELMRGPRVWKG
jgi:hypothetical protein